MVLSVRSRYIGIPLALGFAALTLLFLRLSLGRDPQPNPSTPDKPEIRPLPIYKTDIETPSPSPLPEFFPLAAKAKSPNDLPPVPSWNRPPTPHVAETTRLFIGFTRFWPLLQQVIVSYITAGWPPEDIYVVENTGTMDSNKHGRLTPENPFYLDYNRLTKILGVNVITTPSLQTFAQLQNLYLSEAINNNLSYYFWGHMDVVAQSHEDQVPYKSLYMRAVDVIRETQEPGYKKDDQGRDHRWAIQFFSYDWLAMVNTAAFVEIGGWDTMIGYYSTDCDMHSRIAMAGLKAPIADAGQVFDVGTSMDDLEVLYRRRPKSSAAPSNTKRGNGTDGPNAAYFAKTEEDECGSQQWKDLQDRLEQMAQEKRDDVYRNSWQKRQSGGKGEPFYYDPAGFEKALQMTIHVGTEVYEEKWGHRGCNLGETKLGLGDVWRVEHDW